MDDKGTYVTHDNGHVNIRKQNYRKPNQTARDKDYTPGPGAYETNKSMVGSKTRNHGQSGSVNNSMLSTQGFSI